MRSRSAAKSSPFRPARTATGTSCARACGGRAAPYVITVDPDFSGPMSFLADLWARRRRRGSDRRLSIRRWQPGQHARGARGREPPAQRRVPSRPESRCERRVERDPPVPHRCRQRAVARGDRLRHPAGSAGARLRGRMARARDPAALHAELRGRVESSRRRLRRRTFAPSGRCGSCAIRSRRPTTITARTTARSRCSVTGSGAAIATSAS